MGELLGFSAEHVCRLTGLSKRQIHYWDDTGFFSPTFAPEFRRRPFGRVYSFRDIVGLRAIAVLRKQHKIPLQELRRVGAWLAENTKEATPWSSLHFYVGGRRIYFQDTDAGMPIEPRAGGQSAIEICLEPIAHEMRDAANSLRIRTAEQLGKIERHRYVVRNAPVVAGTRVPTGAIAAFHQDGYTDAQILAEYPRLTQSDVQAALQFEKNKKRERRAG